MRLPAARRINSDNVADEQKPLVDSLATVLNPFIEEVTTIINGNIELTNLKANVVKLSIQTTTGGNVPANTLVRTGLDQVPNGVIVLNIQNADNPNVPVTIEHAPFVLYRPINNQSIMIDKILNLKENRKYVITLLFI